MKLGRRLKVEESVLQDIEQGYRQLCERGYHMLMHWKRKNGFAATYQILNAALQHELVQRKDLAEQICYNHGNYFQQLWIIRNNWNVLFHEVNFVLSRHWPKFCICFPIFTVNQTCFKRTPLLSGRIQTLKLSLSMTQNQAVEIFYY